MTRKNLSDSKYLSDDLSLAELPPRPRINLTYHDGPYDGRSQIVFTADLNGRYPAEKIAIKRLWQEGEFRIQWECSDDVAEAARDLTERVKFLLSARNSDGGMSDELLEGSGTAPGGGLMRMSGLVRTKFLFEVAKLGSKLYQALFTFDEQAMKSRLSFDDDAWRLTKDAMHSVLTRRNIVSVTSPNTLLPWALLYDDPKLSFRNPNSVDYRGFWGFRHETAIALDGGSPRLKLEKRPKVKAAICRSLDPGYAWHLGTPATSAPTAGATAVAEPDKCDDITNLEKKLTEMSWDCLYFFGHAGEKEALKGASSAWLQMSKEILHLEDVLRRGRKEIVDPGVVFLNGCNSAPVYKWRENTVVGALDKLFGHKVSFIGNIAAVPDRFAAEMAVQCWRQFASRQPIGRALLRSRCIMRRRYNNPLGLIYSLFGRGDIRIP